MELLVAIYMGLLFPIFYKISIWLGLTVCLFYPIMIGTIKALQSWFIKSFEMDEVFEFVDLNLAAFPYRFIFLSIDSPLAVCGVLLIKFSYKSLSYLIVFVPFVRKLMLKLKQAKSKLNPCRKKQSTTIEQSIDVPS